MDRSSPEHGVTAPTLASQPKRSFALRLFGSYLAAILLLCVGLYVLQSRDLRSIAIADGTRRHDAFGEAIERAHRADSGDRNRCGRSATSWR